MFSGAAVQISAHLLLHLRRQHRICTFLFFILIAPCAAEAEILSPGLPSLRNSFIHTQKKKTIKNLCNTAFEVKN